MRPNIDPEEWAARVDLAACYRLVAHYGMDDIVYTHISLRVPGSDDHFLINRFGTMFEEITASSLVRIDLDGKVISPEGAHVNEAGFTVHSAVHAARPDVHCVIHTHTRAGMALSTLKQGLLPLCQKSMLFQNRLAYHAFEGIAFDLAERESLQADLGPHKAMVLRNHGLLTCGRDCAEAFSLMYQLDMACKVQMDVLAANAAFGTPTEAIAAKAADQLDSYPLKPLDLEWPALLRKLDRLDPGFRE
ncbi:MAG TPA: class II aldolase/adducin family protein [Reyranella sp.]|nr:class II aldolase/adducin family protein [Reyranella sp.]